MRSGFLALVTLFALLLATAPAHALSTEQHGGTNADGTPRFADPDEQQPPFVAGATEDGAQGSQGSSGPSAGLHYGAPG